MLDKLKNIEKRYEEIGLRLSQPEAYADMTACARLLAAFIRGIGKEVPSYA